MRIAYPRFRLSRVLVCVALILVAVAICDVYNARTFLDYAKNGPAVGFAEVIGWTNRIIECFVCVAAVAYAAYYTIMTLRDRR